MKQPVVLRIYKGEQLFLVKQFTDGQIVIGRQAENQIALPSERVAPLHASIEDRGGTYFVSDLGSETGTKRNGETVLESAIESGDTLEIGEYRVEFYIGAPKPKAVSVSPGPHEVAVTTVTQSKGVEVSASPMSHRPEQVKPESKVEAKPVIPEKPVAEKPVAKPTPVAAKVATVAAAGFTASPSTKLPGAKASRSKKHKKTFAPPSKHNDVKDYVKPSKGTVVEVLVAWRERVITSQHFSEAKTYTYGSDETADVMIPVGAKSKVPFLKIQGRAIVMIASGLTGELVRAGQSGTTLADLVRQNKMVSGASGYELGLEQGEMLKVNLNDQIVLIIRYVSDAPKPLMAPMFDLTASEAVGVIMAFVITGVMFLYTFLYTPPKPLDDLVNEDQLRRAVIIIPIPKPKVQPVEEPQPTPPPQVVKMTPSPKKETKPAQQAKTDVFEKKDPGAASNPIPKPKKAVGGVKQGGQVKVGNTEGAQMQSPKKDIAKSKIFSVFGGGGRQDEIAEATSGAGELAGLANAASGKAGNAQDRPGQGIGTPLKDTGGGGTGTAQFGVPGVKTSGRGGGNSGYGEGGLGGRRGVTIQPGGLGESFSGTIDREAIRRVIRENISAIRACYERELNRNPDLQGKILISWDIGERGRVMRGKVAGNDTGNAAVAQCVLDRIRTYTFPEPPTSAEVTVIFPFYFKN